MITKKSCSLALASLLALGSLVSCASDTGKQSDTSQGVGTTVTSAAETIDTGYTFDSDTKLYSGKTFTVATFSNPNFHYLISTEESGDAFNDSIYRRNANMLDKYGINIEQVLYSDGSGYSTVHALRRVPISHRVTGLTFRPNAESFSNPTGRCSWICRSTSWRAREAWTPISV